MLLFLLLFAQKYNENGFSLHFCCFFFSCSLRNTTKTGFPFIFVAFSSPARSEIQQKRVLPSFLLLFLLPFAQKCNENGCFLHFCCFFFPCSLRNTTKTEFPFIFVAFSSPVRSEMQRKQDFPSFLLLFLLPFAQKYNKNGGFLHFCCFFFPLFAQKYNENGFSLHFCCFFFPCLLRNATKTGVFFVFVAFSSPARSEIQQKRVFPLVFVAFRPEFNRISPMNPGFGSGNTPANHVLRNNGTLKA